MMPNGTERPPDIALNLNLKAVLGLLAALAPLVVGLTMILQLRQDVRDTVRRQIVLEQTVRDLNTRLSEVERSKLTYCISRAADSLRTAPDAGC